MSVVVGDGTRGADSPGTTAVGLGFTAIVNGTFCPCAPVLDEFLDTIKVYGDQIVPVHIEIYKKATGTALVPTVEAWHLPSEPWLFGISADGIVQSRIDGAFGGTEMKALLDALVTPR